MENIIEILQELRIPVENKGFKYLITAIKTVSEDESTLDKILSENGLYGIIAKEHKTTISRTERAIRHVIEHAVATADKNILEKYFKYETKITNKKFIATIAMHLKYKVKL